MLEAVGRIVAATDLPVTADLEGGYGDPAETVRRAIRLGIISANIEDQMQPLAEAAAKVEAIMKAGAAEGVEFVLNARTDAFVLGRDDDQAEVLADAVERGLAFLDASAPVVFVPAKLDEAQAATLVDAFGPQRLTMIGMPGAPWLSRLAGARRRPGLLRPDVAERRPDGAAGAGRGRVPRRRRAADDAHPQLSGRLIRIGYVSADSRGGLPRRSRITMCGAAGGSGRRRRAWRSPCWPPPSARRWTRRIRRRVP